MRSGTTKPEARAAVRPHDVGDRILEVDGELKVVLPPGVRQRLAYQPPVALARGQVVALQGRGVDPGATPVGPHDPDQITLGPEVDPPPDFDHAPSRTPLLDLGVARFRVHRASRLLAGAARAASGRGWFRRAVAGDQGADRRRPLVAGEGGRPAIGSGLEFGENRTRLRIAPVMAEVAEQARSAGQRQGTPDPGIAEIGGVLRAAMGLLFLTKLQSSSLWTWVRDRSRIVAEPTVPPCRPARASRCRTRFGEWCVRRATALRRSRSLRSAKASRTEARGPRMVSKKVCLSAPDVRRQVAR
jgi:hypothetical protein